MGLLSVPGLVFSTAGLWNPDFSLRLERKNAWARIRYRRRLATLTNYRTFSRHCPWRHVVRPFALLSVPGLALSTAGLAMVANYRSFSLHCAYYRSFHALLAMVANYRSFSLHCANYRTFSRHCGWRSCNVV